MQQFSSLLSWCLFTAQRVSGVFPSIIRSSMIAVAASGFTFVSWWPTAQPPTQHECHHNTRVKPEAATAVIELLMMGGKMPKTCWAVHKCQDNKLENCCIWLVIYLNHIIAYYIVWIFFFNFIFGSFNKICLYILNFVTNGQKQETLYMKTCVCLLLLHSISKTCPVLCGVKGEPKESSWWSVSYNQA